MSEPVVHLLEVIDIRDDYRKRGIKPFRPFDFLFEFRVELETVGQSRELVGYRKPLKLSVERAEFAVPIQSDG